MKKFWVLALVIVGFFQAANAATLGTYNLVGLSGGTGPSFDTATLAWVYGYGDLETERDWLFSVEIDETSQGNVYEYSSGHDFDLAVDYLTNGVNDHGQFWVVTERGGFGNGGKEDGLFGGMPDFAGYTITSISIVIEKFTFDSPGSDPQGDGNWMENDHDVSIVVNGVVPIPATVWLFGSCFGLLGWIRRASR